MDRTNWGLVIGSFVAFYISTVIGIDFIDRLALIVFMSTFFGFAWIRFGAWSFSKPSALKVLIKLLSVYFFIGLIAFIYWLIPEYDKPLYNPYFAFINGYSLFLNLIVISYFVFVDYPSKPDFFYLFGLFLVRRSPWRKFFNQYVAGILVRSFFLPLMVSFCYQNINEFYLAWNNINSSDTLSIIRFITVLVFYVDVSVVVPAYMFGASVNGAAIRSVDTSALGVAVALVCYPPFNSAILSHLFPYQDSINWYDAIPKGIIFDIWAVLLVLCLVVYAWASVAMGFRFGNLIYKGLVDWGPYKYFAHPAYLSKNLYWWLYSVPFIASNPADSLKNTIFLAAISFIYYMRAKTEERHLLKYPEYLEYKRSGIADNDAVESGMPV